ncbi:hypothetical protein Back2_17810 [Nocardioides baekrokdamisoli]|uniref:DUF2190 family protein n=1 Tax=Nocardioides baekrokdamisoli TaxID=1804624 RepID=A0A3G9J217_9ACTN|nr:capsid cement protein [Nocardioides baekrokdamisoli]BBH17494.1 hypothetical protein Back2_17810 [Nocardioides baekrokdamisoli]
MAEYLPKTDDAIAWKVLATAAITGGLMVDNNGAIAGANSAIWLGIAGHDANIGDTVTTFLDDIQRPIAAAGGVAKNDRLKCAAGGTLTTWVSGTDAADLLVGFALEAGAAGAKFAAKFIR